MTYPAEFCDLMSVVFAGMYHIRDAVGVGEEGAAHGPQQVLWRGERFHHPSRGSLHQVQPSLTRGDLRPHQVGWLGGNDDDGGDDLSCCCC